MGILDSTLLLSHEHHFFLELKMCLDPDRGPELECLGGVEKRGKGLAAPSDVFEEEGSVKGHLFQDAG